MSRLSALVVGGGPAGSVAAMRLARKGLRTLLIERSTDGHDPVCGGFISADALRLLQRAGIDAQALGGHPVRQIRLVVAGRTIKTGLPFPAIGLSRRRLDAALIEAARTAGASIEFGTTARAFFPEARVISLADGSRIAAEAIMLATGKLNLRGVDRPGNSDRGEPMVGLRLTLRPDRASAAALSGTIELHTFTGGYAGLVLQEDGELNLCLSIAARRLRGADGSPEQLLAVLAGEAPLLAERFGACLPVGSWRSIARIPYGWRASDTHPGLFRVGDQAAVIASLAGDGIAIALASAIMASDALLHGGPEASRDYQRAFARRARRPLALAEMLRTMAEKPRWARPASRLLRFEPRALTWAAAATRIAATA